MVGNDYSTVTKLRAYIDNSEPTDTSYYEINDYKTTYTSYTDTYYETDDSVYIKEIIKKEIISQQISFWSDYVKNIEVKPVRPSIRLRGVCFGGRGWA